MARREKERLEKELEEQEMQEAKALLDQAKKKKGVLVKDGEKLDKKALMQVGGGFKSRLRAVSWSKRVAAVISQEPSCSSLDCGSGDKAWMLFAKCVMMLTQ